MAGRGGYRGRRQRRTGRYVFTPGRQAAWRRAQAKGARMRKGKHRGLMVAGGVGVLAVGVGAAVVVGKKHSERRGMSVKTAPAPQIYPDSALKPKRHNLGNVPSASKFPNLLGWHIASSNDGKGLPSMPRPKKRGIDYSHPSRAMQLMHKTPKTAGAKLRRQRFMEGGGGVAGDARVAALARFEKRLQHIKDFPGLHESYARTEREYAKNAAKNRHRRRAAKRRWLAERRKNRKKKVR